MVPRGLRLLFTYGKSSVSRSVTTRTKRGSWGGGSKYKLDKLGPRVYVLVL